MSKHKRIATAADLAAINKLAGPAVRRVYPPDGGRARVTITDPPRSSRSRRRG